ncbi:MAG: IPT/TIG domain-containing protein [Acetobacteraceae bacterium]|nr:IPT/TIG domain-containing protein [Acetobacteraceae bacterium]
MSAPQITAISPKTGPTSGGTQVSIAGSGLSSVMDVLFGDVSSPAILTTTDTLLVVLSPGGGTIGNVSVSVVSPNGAATSEHGFDYTVGIDSITPASGPVTGGTSVDIKGNGFLQIYGVQFDDTNAPNYTTKSDQLITVVTPAAAKPGTAAISLLDLNGNPAYIEFEAFSYNAAVDVSITSISPATGPLTGGTSISIKGSGLSQVQSAKFNDTPATSVTATSDTLLTLVSPAMQNAGASDISLLDANGNTLYVEFGGFTYAAPSAAPASGDGATGDGTSGSASQGSTQQGAGSGTTGNKSGSQASGQSSDGSDGTTKKAGSDGSTQKSDGSDGSTQKAGASDGGTQKAGGSDSGGQKSGGSSDGGGQKAGGSNGGGQKSGSGDPAPSGDYIPGGRMIVPDGKTGLGGTAGTGEGFGVGTLMAGGGGSAAPSNLPYYVDPALTAQLVQSLIGLVQNAASPDALESQNIILRRMALEGDVIGSRMPPPRNISEVGGYINLLGTLKENSMREQALAGILGVAGPPQPLGWITNTQALAMVAITNDRPAVAAQPNFPLTVLVRSDFVPAVQNALRTLHSFGATLPLVSPPAILLPPGGPGSAVPANILFYLGRTLMIAPSAALSNPATDPVAILAPTNPGADYGLAAQVLNPGGSPVSPANVQAVLCTPASESLVSLNQVEFVPIGPILQSAGFYSSSPFPVPANSTVHSWAILTNTTGLVAGETQLGQELSLLYRKDQITNSVFAAMLNWTWNGTTFAQ